MKHPDASLEGMRTILEKQLEGVNRAECLVREKLMALDFEYPYDGESAAELRADIRELEEIEQRIKQAIAAILVKNYGICMHCFDLIHLTDLMDDPLMNMHPACAEACKRKSMREEYPQVLR